MKPESRSASLFAKLFLSMMAFTILPLGLLAFYMTGSIRGLATDVSRYELVEHCRLIGSLLVDEAALGRSPAAVLAGLGESTQFRLSLIDTEGVVLFDSQAPSGAMENHKARAEVRSALESGSGTDFRLSATTGVETSYAAVRLAMPAGGGQPAQDLILRTALPMPLLAAFYARQYQGLLLASLLLGLAASLAALGLSRRLGSPASVLTKAAKAWAGGDFSVYAQVQSPREFAELSASLNAMAFQLKDRLEALQARRNELATILDAMGEALVVTDPQGKVTRWNPEAEQLFGATWSPGVTVIEASRCAELAALEIRCRQGQRAEADIVIHGAKPRTLKVQGAPLPERGGAVLVMADISRLVQLETVRRDFVANVSHELKTPIQSIKGFAETLQSMLQEPGAIRPDPRDQERFLAIILRNTSRMEAIISDLLSLARLEHQESQGPLRAEPVELAALAAQTLANLRLPPERSLGEIQVSGDPGVRVSGNAGLIEQALVNLLDNALRYTPAGTPIRVDWEQAGARVRLSVSDQGPGIPYKDQDRIFERFYRVEKSRTREAGGTGLGLAIVHHVAQVHGGSATVQSTPGQGCRFSLELPAWPESGALASE